MSDCADVPPLEDMSEELEKIKSLRTQSKRVERSDIIQPLTHPDSSQLKPAASTGITVNGSKSKKVTKEKSQAARTKEKTAGDSKSSFGGFKKGFLVSSSDSKPQAKKAPPPSKEKTPPIAASSAKETCSKDADIPFIRPKDEAKSSLEFPEVQQAMKEAFPLLQSKGGYLICTV